MCLNEKAAHTIRQRVQCVSEQPGPDDSSASMTSLKYFVNHITRTPHQTGAAYYLRN